MRFTAFAVCCFLILACSRVTNAPLLLKSSPVQASKSTLARGKVLYKFYCAGCHGIRGEGGGEDAVARELPAPPLGPFVERSSVNDLAFRVACGKADSMPHFSDELTEEELWILSAYVISLVKEEKS